MENNTRNLQLCILDMMKDIDKICKKHKIKYYLAYGSCIGAVRHKGFIPWDDDFDIMIKYDQYEEFLKYCKEELNAEKYFVQTLDTDKNYYLSFAKIRNIQTTMINKSAKEVDMVNGVYIDIFPIVGYPNSKYKQKIFEINRAFVLSANRNVINNKCLSFLFRLILKLVGKKNIIKYCTKECIKYNCNECDKIISVFDGDGVDINITTNEILGNPKYVQFEDMKLPVPEKTDEYLTHIYGDYMKMPSVGDRNYKTHELYILDLNHSYEEYKKINNK